MERQRSQTALDFESPELSIAATLGVARFDSKATSKLEREQELLFGQWAPVRLAAHMVLAISLAYLAPVPSIAAWWLPSLAIWLLGACVIVRWLKQSGDSLSRSRIWTWRLSLSLVSALLWTIPMFLVATEGREELLLACWLFPFSLAAGIAMFHPAAPLRALLLNVLCSACALTLLVYYGQLLLALVVTVLMLALGAATFSTARTYWMGWLAHLALREKEEVVSLLLRDFEENEADWLWEVDVKRRLRRVSPRFAHALNGTVKDVEGKPLLELIAGTNWESGNFPASLHELAEKLRNRENFSNLIVQVPVKSEERWWELSGTPISDDRGMFVGFRGVGSDVTKQRESSEKIAYLARYDTLTSLPNRLMLTEALGDAIVHALQWRTRCALLMIDLDRFKAVNDSLGHLTGDRLLAQVSSRLQALMGENAMVGRLGGDEFAIVVRDASDTDSLEKLAEQVITSLSEPYQLDQHTLYIGASIGSATGPRDGQSVEELMRNADLALYRAKDVGGGVHTGFEPVLHAFAEERRQLEVSLHNALDNDEFRLNYQPIVDARSEELVSFEALLRWNSPDHGFVSPGKFIPLAEDTRLIVPIGKWVLHQACLEARNWPEHIKVNVNVSPEQLLEPDFHQDIIDALASSGLRPGRLEIEVTESIFLRDASIARDALEQVMALGCSVALDDFGTGYSSLGYLRKLRFSTIKIDRTFVLGAAEGAQESLAIINAVVAMAKSLQITTIAEGVETSDQVDMVRALGCDRIQGFFFGRPMLKSEADELFRGTASVSNDDQPNSAKKG